MAGVNPGSLLEDLIQTLAALVSGVARPVQFASAAVVLAALAAGWLIARAVRRHVDERLERLAASGAGAGRAAEAVRFSVEGFRRLAFPIGAQAALWLGELGLRLAGLVNTAADARLLRLAMTLLGAMALVRLLVYVLRRVMRTSAVLATFERLIAVAIWLVVALHVVGVLSDVIGWLDATRVPIGAKPVSLWALLVGALSVALTVLGALWIGSALELRLMQTTAIDGNVRVVAARVLRALLLVLAVLLSLSLAGIDLTVLSVFGGALGVGLGLGLQRVASNYISGFILLLDRSLRIGDIVTVGAHAGVVTQINTRYTVIRAGDGTEAIVPNELLISTPVINQSASDRRLRLSLKVTVAYGTDVERVLPLLEGAMRDAQRVLSDPPPQALLKGFGADGLDIELGFWIPDPDMDRGNVTSDVAHRVLKTLADAGVDMPLPQRVVRLVKSSAEERVPAVPSVPPANPFHQPQTPAGERRE